MIGHFKELLNAGRIDTEEERGQIWIEQNISEEFRNDIVARIAKSEIANSLKKSKGRKSSGLDALQV